MMNSGAPTSARGSGGATTRLAAVWSHDPASARMGALLALLTLAAWVGVIVPGLSTRMADVGGLVPDSAMAGAGMDTPVAAGPAIVGELARFVGAWAVMMAAMMLPAIAPRMLLYRRAAAGTDGGRGGTATRPWLMALGYVLVWALFGVPLALACQIAAGLAGTTSLAALVPYGGAALLILTGVYQLTPTVTRFLERCRDPLGSLRRQWRPGAGGAFRMGIAEGGASVACCWLVMVSLVAAGGMAVAWVMATTAVLLAEKLLPRGRQIARAAGVVLVLAGGLIALQPGLAGALRG